MSSNKKIIEGLLSASPSDTDSVTSTSYDSPSRESTEDNSGAGQRTFVYKRVVDVPTDIAKRIEITKQISAQILYGIMLDEALRSATPLEQDEIRSSQLCAVMSENFGEILKNSMDAFIGRSGTGSDQLCLSMRIDIDGATMTMCLEDDAGGFSEKFLKKVTDEKDRRTYIDMKSQSDKMGHSDAIGGRGLGIRNLIANVDTGHNLLGTTEEIQEGKAVSKAVLAYHYIKPTVSNIAFTNVRDAYGHPQGAAISVTMTCQPVVASELMGRTVHEADDAFELADVPPLFLPSFLRPCCY